MKKAVMIMVDGFGIPQQGWSDSLYAEYCISGFTDLFEEYSVPIDANLSVDGIPQSATGQTALFTGKNAAELMNGHIQGFPGPSLREIINSGNLFASLKDAGLEVAFANAYVNYSLLELAERGMRSVTTVMTEYVLGCVRTLHDLLAGNAVYHDITHWTLPEHAGAPFLPPEAAAENLAELAGENEFTLFEYFLTDRAGHKQDEFFLSEVLHEFSLFFLRLISAVPKDTAVILTSDHGNCEDISVRTHTRNPVPFFLYGADMPESLSVSSITDVHNCILSLYAD